MEVIHKFYISSSGERDAGISGVTAIVDLPIPDGDLEYLNIVRGELKKCFSVIFDDKNVSVLTNLECDEL